MKRLLPALVVAFASLCFGAGAARAQSDAEIRQELESKYKQLAEAHDRRDLKTIVGMKTADFHAIFADGRVGDSKTMEEYSRQFLEANAPPFNIRFTIRKLTVSDNKLIAVAEVLQEASRMREMAGKLRKVETSVVQRETWARTPDGWKLKVVDDVRDQKKFIDGKRIDPTKPYNPDDPPYNPGDEKKP